MSSVVSNAFALGWGPGVIGFVFTLGFTSVYIGQVVFYWMAFVNDHKLARVAVHLILLLDMLHAYFTCALFWRLLIVCHRDVSLACERLPWLDSYLQATISFIVQCFYTHRVFVISDKNWKLAGVVLVTAITQYGLGIGVMVTTAETRSAIVMFTSPFAVPYVVASAICEGLISGVIIFYLRPGRTGVKLANNYVQQLIVVSVQMGVFNSLVAIMWLLLFFIQSGRIWTAFPSAILCKVNANSMLAVLNARKSIRSRKKAQADLIALSTINAAPSSQ